MQTLIIITSLSFLFLITMLFCRGERYSFWMNIINSKFFQKINLVLEKISYFFKNLFKNRLNFTRATFNYLLGNLLAFCLLLKKIFDFSFKKVQNFVFKFYYKSYKQKVKKPASEYLKKVEQYKSDMLDK